MEQGDKAADWNAITLKTSQRGHVLGTMQGWHHTKGWQERHSWFGRCQAYTVSRVERFAIYEKLVLAITSKLSRIPTELIEPKNSLDSKLKIKPIYFIWNLNVLETIGNACFRKPQNGQPWLQAILKCCIQFTRPIQWSKRQKTWRIRRQS